MSGYTSWEGIPCPYRIQVSCLAVLKSRKREWEEPSEESPLPCAGTLPIPSAGEALRCEGVTVHTGRAVPNARADGWESLSFCTERSG